MPEWNLRSMALPHLQAALYALGVLISLLRSFANLKPRNAQNKDKGSPNKNKPFTNVGSPNKGCRDSGFSVNRANSPKPIAKEAGAFSKPLTSVAFLISSKRSFTALLLNLKLSIKTIAKPKQYNYIQAPLLNDAVKYS